MMTQKNMKRDIRDDTTYRTTECTGVQTSAYASVLGVPPAGYPPRTVTRQILEVGLGLTTG